MYIFLIYILQLNNVSKEYLSQKAIYLYYKTHIKMTQEEKKKIKRYPIIISDSLMSRISLRTKSLETNFSNYVRQLILKDLETFEQSQSKQP